MIKARAIAGDVPAGECVPEEPAAVHLAQASGFRRHPGHPFDQAPDPCGERPSRDRGRRPQHQDRPRRHPRDRVLRPDPATDLGRPQSGAAPAPTCAAIEQLVSMRPHQPGGGRRPDRGLSLSAACRAPAADDRRPADPDAAGAGPELDRLALFCGHADTAEFSETLLHHLGQVEDHYADLFEEAPSLGEQGNLVFTGTDDDPATVADAGAHGLPRRQRRSHGLVRAWHHGRYRATRSARARELLTELMPKLLEVLCTHRRSRHRPSAASTASCGRCRRACSSSPCSIPIPDCWICIADVMGSAPLLADHLSRYPDAAGWRADGGLLRGGAGPRCACRATCSASFRFVRRLPGPPQPDVPLDQGPAVPDRRAPAEGRRRTAMSPAGELSDVADARDRRAVRRGRGGVRARIHGRLPGAASPSWRWASSAAAR